jgi:hypothetical protein
MSRVLLVLLLTPLCAEGAALRVPEDYPTVLAAVDAAVAGDSVLVGPGTWTATDVRGTPFGVIEAAMFLRPGVAVIGTAGAEQTIVDGGPLTGPFVEAAAHLTDGPETALLLGLTLTSGDGAVGAIEAGPLEIRECHIVDCGRAAIQARDVSIVMEDCLVRNNEFDQEPGLRKGAVWGLATELEARGCRFEGNANSAVRIEDFSPHPLPTVVVEDCEFVENGNRAVLSLKSTVTLIEGCLFLRNTRGGVGVNGTSGAIRFCTFAYDSGATSGGGVFSLDSDVVIENNTFYRCHAAWYGSAIDRENVDGGTRNNIVYGCQGPHGAFFMYGGTKHPTTGCNLFFANEGDGYDGDWEAGPTDIFEDPQFCDEASLNLGIADSSPAAPGNNPTCGLIGAEEVSCGTVSAGASLETTSWGRIKGFYRVPPSEGSAGR